MNVLTQLPRSVEQKVQALQNNLQAKGYEVARGFCNLFTIDDCKYAIASLGHCLGNNPAAPYLFPSVPLWSDEFADPLMKDTFGPLPGNTSATYRLDKRDAVVILGLLPPPGKYFGIQTYVFSRAGTLNDNDPLLRHLTDPAWRKILFSTAPNRSRVLVVASIGNSNNNVVIARRSGAAFDQERSFIITPDAGLAREITGALVETGASTADEVFTEPVSPEIARVGLQADDDDYLTIIRYAQPEDKEAGERWRHEIPLAVLRVRDGGTPASEPQPWPMTAYETKTGRSELALKDDRGKLVQAVKEQWGQSGAPVAEFQSLQLALDLVGQHCLTRPMNCLGDTQDTDYQVSPSLTLDDDEVIAVVGTLGTQTGNATYVGLSVNRVEVLTGVVNISDDELRHTASAYSASAAGADKFYVYYFARDCRGLPNGLNVTTEMVPPGEAVKIIQRNYIEPGTARGPDPALLLNPVAIVFDGKKR